MQIRLHISRSKIYENWLPTCVLLMVWFYAIPWGNITENCHVWAIMDWDFAIDFILKKRAISSFIQFWNKNILWKMVTRQSASERYFSVYILLQGMLIPDLRDTLSLVVNTYTQWNRHFCVHLYSWKLCFNNS